MLIAVISDTHRIPTYINLAKDKLQGADILIHLGDNTDDIETLTKGFKGEVYAVKGNCDFSNKYPKEQIIQVCNKKIYFTHGDLFGVKYGMNNIFYKGKEVGADIVLFGHTHQHIIFEEEGIYFMNPGSISLPKSSGRYIGFIDLQEEKLPQLYFKSII